MSSITGPTQGKEHPSPAHLLGHYVGTARIKEFCAYYHSQPSDADWQPSGKNETNYVKPE
jgi:hypothetical protein